MTIQKVLCGIVMVSSITAHAGNLKKIFNVKELYRTAYPLIDFKKIIKLQKFIDHIENQQLTYQSFDQRKGIAVDSFSLDCTGKTPIATKVDDDFMSSIEINKTTYELEPQSIFSNREIKDIVLNEVIPQTLKTVKEMHVVPATILVKLRIERLRIANDNTQNNRIDWHQDPGFPCEKKNTITSVLMLSNPFDPNTGWTGGAFMLKKANSNAINPHIEEITSDWNKAIIFDNKECCHAVTHVTPRKKELIRDVLVLAFDFEKEDKK